MKTFYSILYCSIRPNVNERVSIGLLVASESKVYFSYSQEKLLIIKPLLSSEAYNLIKTNLKSLTKIYSECMNDFIIDSFKGHALFRDDYISYLSRYSNNLLTYSAPANIDIQLSQIVFNKLFEKFVFGIPSAQEKVKPVVEIVKRRLAKTISNHVAFDVELDKTRIPGLIVPAKVWFIGKNEVEVTGEVKDFNTQVHTLQQQLNAHLFLIEKLKDTPEGKHGKFFMIADEPSKQMKENHSLWESIRNANILDIVPTSEIQRIEDYMDEHGVEPIFNE